MYSKSLGINIGCPPPNPKTKEHEYYSFRRIGFTLHVAVKDGENFLKGHLLLIRHDTPCFVIKTKPPQELIDRGSVSEDLYFKYETWFDNLKDELIQTNSSFKELVVLGHCVLEYRIGLKWAWVVPITNPIIEAYHKLESLDVLD